MARPGKFRQNQARELQIDLHGKTRVEALEALELILDRALLQNTGRITIVHGLGTGALKKAVHDYLAGSRHVRSFQVDPGNPGQTFAFLD